MTVQSFQQLLVTNYGLQPSGYTGSQGSIGYVGSAAVGGGGPKITSIQITNSSYTVLDDTAVDTAGGYIKIVGTGFESGCQVLVNNTPASSVSFINSTTVHAQVAANTAGTYIVYLVNADGGVAIAVNGLTYSATPAWVTGSTLSTQLTNVAISVQLNAASATAYSLAAGSTLPEGLSLSSSGLLSGTVSVVTETTYSFVVNAVDSELQDSPRTFSLTVSVVIVDLSFNLTTLLLPGNGTNNATNNTFLDSSTSNFTVTRSGNTTQGNFSPFSQTGWSNFFDGTNDWIGSAQNNTTSVMNFAADQDFTMEFWVYSTSALSDYTIVNYGTYREAYTSERVIWVTNKSASIFISGGSNASSTQFTALFPLSATLSTNSWNHIALVRLSNSIRVYVNGVGGTAVSAPGAAQPLSQRYDLAGPHGLWLGVNSTNWTAFNPVGLTGYISNFRYVVGTAVYTANFTPATAPLTAVANTRMLTCQSNRFVDNSTNNFAITSNGEVRVQAFSPFNPTTAYSAAVVGGSVYFDGSGDFLTVPGDAAFQFGTGDFTVEAWIYLANDLPNPEGTFLAGTINGSVDLCYYDSSFRFGRANVAWDTIINHVLARRTWHHVAFTKESGVAKVYVNGALVGSAANTQNYNSGTFRINAAADSSRQLIGYMSGHRVVKGTAVYTANFTPPTAPPTAIANTSVLLNFTNDPIADATSKNAVETVGDTKTSTVQSKWGGSSIFFDGSDSLTIPPTNLQLNLGARNFTIEMWAYLSGNITAFTLFLKSNSYELKTDSNRWVWQINANTNVFVTNGNLPLNTWAHLALVRNGSTTTLYLNGTSVASGTSTNATDNTSPLQMGTSGFIGYINDFRITNGLARYTENFTPPTAAFPIQ